jgi:adenylosuccinate synthase
MRKKLAFVVGQVKNPILTKLYEKEAYDWESMLAEYMGYAKQLDPYIKDTYPIIQDALDRKANILLEGAQATMLDLDFGTYPYVTSSNPTAGGALTGSGIAPTKVDLTIGVYKAYTSRVGYGPFPSELLDEVGDQIRERGHEFGTVTGRARRIGWFDAAIARYSARVNGVGVAALMRLDILDDQPSLKICTGYDFRGARHDHPLANISHYKHCKPIYEDVPGWEKEIGAAREWQDLPQRCRDYVDRIGELIGVPVELVGTGPRRDQFVTRGRQLFD